MLRLELYQILRLNNRSIFQSRGISTLFIFELEFQTKITYINQNHTSVQRVNYSIKFKCSRHGFCHYHSSKFKAGEVQIDVLHVIILKKNPNLKIVLPC